MKLLSIFQTTKVMKCGWCQKEMESAMYSKNYGRKTYNFCSDSCKQWFRKSGQGKYAARSCSSCAMSPKVWD